MIISASRRTDIPAHYSDWFFDRIREGYVLVRNPMNYRQVSRVSLALEAVDGIVFWTKNPTPMLKRFGELRDYSCCFHFTITPYGKDIEPGVPAKNPYLLNIFRNVSESVGAHRVIWRYDPILVNEKYTEEYHVRAFSQMADALAVYTDRVTISFVNGDYKAPRGNKDAMELESLSPCRKSELAASLAQIALSHGLAIDACAESLDLSDVGVSNAKCVDVGFFENTSGGPKKDRSQRADCCCDASVDIGAYNTCISGCLYCYANYKKGTAAANHASHNKESRLLVGETSPEDRITDRRIY